jgi:hypothetical protein
MITGMPTLLVSASKFPNRHNFLFNPGKISFTPHFCISRIKRANSSKSSNRNQLLPAAKITNGSSAARLVQLKGISQIRPFSSRKYTRWSGP